MKWVSIASGDIKKDTGVVDERVDAVRLESIACSIDCAGNSVCHDEGPFWEEGYDEQVDAGH